VTAPRANPDQSRNASSFGSDSAAVLASGGLRGLVICMAYRGRFQYASRLLQEINALQGAGAKVLLLAQRADHGPMPDGVKIVATPSVGYRASESRLRLVRVAVNIIKSARARILFGWHTSRVLRKESVDLLWAVDWPMLSRYARIARLNRIPVVYETLDLVAEQTPGDAERAEELRRETRVVARVGGFVVAGDAFADYYTRRLADSGLSVAPAVCENVPEQVVESIRETSGVVRLLFLGALTANRNLPNLIRAMALTKNEVTLTLQGENWLGESLADEIARLGIGERVQILDPVPPGEIIAIASQYDVGVVSLEPASLNEMLAPTTKLYTYMAAGLAVLGSDLPGIESIVSKYENGWLVTGTEPAAWARALDAVGSASNAQIDAMKGRSLRAVESRTWPVQRACFLAEFQRAVDRRSRIVSTRQSSRESGGTG